MNLQVRNRFALAAVGALASSLVAAPLASAAPVTSGSNEDSNSVAVFTGVMEKGRIAGKSRFGTAVEASKALQGEVGNTVLIANSTAWTDTLAATPVADVLDAPVLYTRRDGLHADTITELKRLKAAGVTEAIILGGEVVINPVVATQLAGLGFNVDRIGGYSRYDTALLLAAEAVDYYEDADGDLAATRAQIAGIVKAEAAFQTALANWNAARANTAKAFDAVQSAAEELQKAQAELQKLTNQLVTVPGAPTDAEVLALSNALVAAQNRASDLGTVEAFVNDRLSEYVSEANPSEFQDDVWNTEVLPFFDAKATTYTVTLSSGTFTGTLRELQAKIAILGAAVAVDGNETTVKAVEEYLDDQQAAAATAIASARAAYAEAVAKQIAAADASAANDTLKRKIAAAQKVVAEKSDAYDKALQAHAAAQATEALRYNEFVVAAAARPSGDALKAAQASYNNTLNAVLSNAKKYPAFLATGTEFADALAAGPAAADEKGVILLTKGSTLPDSTARYLKEGPNTVAVGGPAAAAYRADVKYVGYSRYETATMVAAAYFDPTDYVGLASGQNFPDAVVGGALMANVDGTLVLTRHDALPTTTRDFLSYEADQPHVVVFGGPIAIEESVEDAARQALDN